MAAGPSQNISRNRFYRDEQRLYLVVDNNTISICLLCIEQGVNSALKVARKVKEYFGDARGVDNSQHLLTSKKNLEPGNPAMVNAFGGLSPFANRIALSAAHQMAKNKQPISHSKLYAELLIDALRMIYHAHENYIDIMTFAQTIPLSRGSITRRLELLSGDIRRQFLRSLNECMVFSIQVDGSTDMKSVEQISIFLRLVFPDSSIKEHLLACISLHQPASTEVIYNALKAELIVAKVPLYKLVSITTDGIMTKTEWSNELIIRLRQDPDFPPFTVFHSILHQLTLAAKSFSVVGVVQEVEKMINSILANKHQRLPLRDQMDIINKIGKNDLRYYTEVRWLTRGLMLERFYEQMTTSRVIMELRNNECDLLRDTKWMLRFAYVTDFMVLINDTDRNIQGGMKFIGEYIDRMDKLKTYIKFAIECFKVNSVPHFCPRLTQLVNETGIANFDGRQMLDCTTLFLDAVNEFLLEFVDVKTIIDYLKNPFVKPASTHELIVTITKFHIVDKVQLNNEMAILVFDNAMISLSQAGNDIWRVIDHSKYPNLKMIYMRTLSYFGTTFLCELTFWCLDYIRLALGHGTSEKHLRDVLIISTSTYKPNFDRLAQRWKQNNLQDA